MKQRSSAIKIAVAALLVISIAAGTVTPAAAGVNWSLECVEFSGGGDFYGSSADGLCVEYAPSEPCGSESAYYFGVWQNDRYELLDCFSGVYSTFSALLCGEVKNVPGFKSLINEFGITCSGRPPSKTTDISAGEPLDFFIGNCGAYLSSPPVDGTATFQKIAKSQAPKPAPKFVKNPCQINYMDLQGNSIPGFGTIAYVYFNMDAGIANLYSKGEVDLFVYDGDVWASCSAILYPDVGEYGRLACMTNGYIFGIAYK